MKTFKEYTGVSGVRIGGIDSVHPIASLGDKPPKGKGSRAPRAVGLVAQKNIKGTPLHRHMKSKGILKK
jgi:hypothetical protein